MVRQAPLIAQAYGGWEDAIRWAVENQDEVRAKAEVAKNYVLAQRTIQHSIRLWRDALHV